MGITPSWPTDANSEVWGRVRAAQKASEGSDRQTDTHSPSTVHNRPRYMGGRYRVGRVGHGPAKILVGWATMHLAPPIIGLYVR